MTVAEKCVWAESLVKVLNILININDDPTYTKEEIVSNLLDLVKLLEQNEQTIR